MRNRTAAMDCCACRCKASPLALALFLGAAYRRHDTRRSALASRCSLRDGALRASARATPLTPSRLLELARWSRRTRRVPRYGAAAPLPASARRHCGLARQCVARARACSPLGVASRLYRLLLLWTPALLNPLLHGASAELLTARPPPAQSVQSARCTAHTPVYPYAVAALLLGAPRLAGRAAAPQWPASMAGTHAQRRPSAVVFAQRARRN